jgi:hypothetical protein
VSSASIAALFTLLRNDAGLAALISTRIYPGALPQGATLPAVTYRQVNEAPDYTQSGPSGFSNPRMQFDCLAATYEGAYALADALIAAAHTSLVAGNALQATVESVEDGDNEPDLRMSRIIVDLRLAFNG